MPPFRLFRPSCSDFSHPVRSRRVSARGAIPVRQEPMVQLGSARDWYESLERLDPEVVRASLAQNTAGSAGDHCVGAEIKMTKGFVEEWLAWHGRRKAEREDHFRRAQVFWTRWA